MRRTQDAPLEHTPDPDRTAHEDGARRTQDPRRASLRREAAGKDVRRPRVVIVQRAIRQYRGPFLDQLREQLDHRGIALSVMHNTPHRDDDHRKDVAAPDWAHRLDARMVGVNGKHLHWQAPPPELWEADLVVVEQATQLLLNYLLLLRRHAGGPLVGFWGHGTSPYRDAHRIGEAVKRWVSGQPDWWFAYTDGVVDRVSAFGFPRDRITSVRNATDTRALAAEVEGLADEEVERLRGELGVGRGPVGLFVGALVPEKKLEFLVQAGEAIRRAVPEFELVIAGDGAMQGWVSQRVADRPWLHYAGQRFGRELAALLRLSSFLMVPAWVGLVVTDSFAAGRPLFASRSEAHGPEIEYVVHGVNGLLIDDGHDPRCGTRPGSSQHCRSRGCWAQQRGCRAEADRYGVEDMAVRFADGIEEALATGRRPSFQRPRWSLPRR
jgi:glycosyltransferase involved in cell wall biosynthesis